MSNHYTLKPDTSVQSLRGFRDDDFRITAPNVAGSGAVLKKECMLFYYPDCEDLAKQIASVSMGNVELAEISWKRFADGFPNLYIKDAIKARNKNVAFLASFTNPDVIFEQMSIIYQLPRLFVGSFTLVLPYCPTGTAERVEAEGDVATAFTLGMYRTSSLDLCYPPDHAYLESPTLTRAVRSLASPHYFQHSTRPWRTGERGDI